MNGHQQEQPMEFNLPELAFRYVDHNYFNWFCQSTERTLRAVWIWKGLHRGATRLGDGGIPLERIWNGQGLVEKGFDGLPLVTRAFLHHLHKPVDFPILDKYVWVAMGKIKPGWGRLPQAPAHWENHYRKYILFFNNLYRERAGEIDRMNVPQIHGVDPQIVRRRVLDRALWTYGKIDKEGA